jgi:intracellular sulfur oxidation DsrE/DsrF family protein
MQRRNFVGLLAALTAASAAMVRRSSAGSADSDTILDPGKPHGLVFHVGLNDPGLMATALRDAGQVTDFLAEQGIKPQIEIVATGPGLHMLRDDTSPVKDAIKEFHAKFPDVVLSACNNAKKHMEANEGRKIVIVPEARIVPAGVVRMMVLHEQHWTYVWA